MSVTFETLPGEQNIIITTYSMPFDPVADLNRAGEEFMKTLSETNKPVFAVLDVRQVNLTFSDIVQSMGTANSSPVDTTMLHFCFIGDSEMVRLAAESYAQRQYGELKINVFLTLEEGSDYARSLLYQ